MSWLCRVQMFARLPSDLPRDGISNTLYFRVGGALSDPNDDTAQDVAEDVRDAFVTLSSASNGPNALRGMTYSFKAYGVTDPKHYGPRAEVTGNFPAAGAGTRGPREVALCLSYRTDPPNTSRRRGRIYVGPWMVNDMSERPAATSQNALLALGSDLAGIGGENQSWRVYSPTTGEDHHIRHIWVDNAWDTIRGRGQAPSSRATAEV